MQLTQDKRQWIPDSVRVAFRPWVWKVRYIVWCMRGRPEHDKFSFAKRTRLLSFGQRFGCVVFVETGTNVGDTVEFMRHHFAKVISIELSNELYVRATKRFKNCGNVHLWQGDSAKVLSEMLAQVTGRALLWLDGHYSGSDTARGDVDCPILDELDAIGKHGKQDDCILVDDARCFGTLPGFPSVETIRQRLLEINPNYSVTVEHDWIIAIPRSAN